ncbi:MAG: CapA family protein [Bacteroidales bacterium]|nr:CapA family protein [Bacteroidales bacterium]
MLKLGFTGDFNLGGCYSEMENIFSPALSDHLSGNQANVINLEGPLVNSGKRDWKNMASPVATVEFLKKHKLNICNISNNHMADFGNIEIENTIRRLNDNNIDWFGWTNKHNNQHLVIDKNNIKVLLISIFETPHIAFKYQIKKIRESLAHYREKVDWIVLNYHGGEEFCILPSPYKRKFLKKLVDLLKPNIIIGHHSHTIQPFEIYNNCHIFYSLGNFVFDFESHQYFKYTEYGLVLDIAFEKQTFTINHTYSKKNTDNTLGITSNVPRELMFDMPGVHDYKTKWKREAFRMLNDRKPVSNSNKTMELKNKSILHSFFDINLYRKFLKIILIPYQRQIFVSAFVEKFKNRKL